MSKKRRQEFTVKTCPFCGGQNMRVRYTPPYVQRLEYWITCLDCHSRNGFYKTPEDAVEAWNKRAPEDGVEVIAEMRG